MVYLLPDHPQGQASMTSEDLDHVTQGNLKQRRVYLGLWLQRDRVHRVGMVARARN